jgi:hypothetical protein
MPVASATSCGVRVSNQGKGTGNNTGIELLDLPAGPNNYSVFSASPAQSYFAGNVGINWTTPTANLEVSGTTKLRGTLEVTGNITSTGTAHSFAAKSIPASAISGLSAAFAIPQKTPASQTATGTAGEFAYDANYLYGCVATNDWRRIPWMNWLNESMPGAGAGAHDDALPAITGATPHIAAAGSMPTTATAGKILVTITDSVPALATGIKIQYRTHGGNWVDATIAKYFNGNTVTANFLAWKTTTGVRKIELGGPPPGIPYICRVAWVSTLGTGLWSQEFNAVTPTA